MVLLGATPVAGRVSDTRPDEIIVTAPGIAAGSISSADVTGADIDRNGAPDLLGSLERNLAGVSLSEAQSNPFQPNLIYRGYAISPLQGTAQGLAVYLDGARFNQPFGDTVDFDLLPEAAIDRMSIEEASPVYGLNALGGALVVATKTGRSSPGATLWGAGGNFGWAEGGGEIGWARGSGSGYATLQAKHDGGWRRHSPSTLYNGYADLGYDGATAGLHLKLMGARSSLTGNGSAPVELLAADRRAVFTWPDNTRNRFGGASLHPWFALSDRTRIEGSLYLQRLRQRTSNGDAADVETCEDLPEFLCLESNDDGDDPLIDTSGDLVPDLLGEEGAYGVFNRTRTRTTGGGALAQLVDRRSVPGGENLLRIGASYDGSRTRFQAETELGELTDERSVVGLGPIIDQPDRIIAPVDVLTHSRYTGLFAADTLTLGARVSVDLALRYNSARISLDDRLGTALDGRHNFHRLNPGAFLSIRASPAFILRAGYSEANRAPTPAELACAGPGDPCSLTNFFVGDPPLKQVVSKSWQTGGTGTADINGWSVRGQVTAYRAVNHDDIQFVASGVRGRAFFRNIGRTRRQGLDINVSATRGAWILRAGYAFTDATFRTPLVLNSPDNPAADDDGRIQIAGGDRIPGIPRHRAILAADYDGRSFTIGGNLQAQSGQYLFGDEANLQPKVKAFVLADIHGSVRLIRRLSLFAEVTNLFDRHYATFGTFSETEDVFLAEAPDASDPRSLGPGAPRRWKAGLRASF
jgi:outer membrane receptor protein involved in Fe transport